MNRTAFPLIAAALGTCCLQGLYAQATVSSKYQLSFYGQIKSDIMYDEHGVTGDDYAQYVASDQDTERDFRASARGTRLGLDITDGDRISGKIEADFLGLSENVSAGSAGSTADLRIRHAYMTLKDGNFEILAGQTWHLLPLELPGTNNEFFLGYSGALWYRAPQFRATCKVTDGYTLAAAIVRPTRKLTDSEGTASGLPQLQAQAQGRFGTSKFTLAGALGKWRNTATGDYGLVSLVDIGYNIPLNKVLTLNGQIWTGQNLYDFLGGLGNMGYGKDEINSSGGFLNLLIKPARGFYYNFAYGVDDPKNDKITASATAKTKNTTWMANLNSIVYDKVTLTFEADYKVTEYKLTTGYKDLDDLHYQFSMKFPF